MKEFLVIALGICILSACQTTPKGNSSPVSELEEAPLFTDEDTSKAKLDIPSLFQEIEGTEGITRYIGQEINLNLAMEENYEKELETQRTLPGANGVICYVRYKPSARKPYKIYAHDQSTDIKFLVYSSKNQIQSTSCNFDSRIFAFAEHDGEDFELYLLTYSGISQLTDNTTNDIEISLDSNGTRVAWEGDKEGRRAIYWRDLGFSSANVLTSSLSQEDPKLTGRGNIIVLVSLLKDGRYRIRSYDINANSYTKIYTSVDKLSNPSSSDSESFVSWKQEEPDGAEVIRVIDANGNIMNVFKSNKGINRPMLTCNGQGLSYSTKYKDSWVVYALYWQQGTKAPIRRRVGNDFLGSFWATRCLAGVQEGQLTTDDLIDYDRTYSTDYPYYVDYYDLKGLKSTLNSQAVGDKVVITLQSTFSSNLVLYNKDQRQFSGGGAISSSSEGVLSFTVESGINYLIGVSSNYSSQTGSYAVSTSFGLIEPSDFGRFPPVVDSEKGKLTRSDLINYDTTSNINYPYYIDYYDLNDLSSDLSAQATSEEVVLTLRSNFSYSSAVLFLYNKDKRRLSGGGTITSSGRGFISFTLNPKINYLIGVSSNYEDDTGTYNLSTSSGDLTPSDFGKVNFIDSEDGNLTTSDLIDPDNDYTHYIDYYDLGNLDNSLSVQAVGDRVVVALRSARIADLQLSLYNKNQRSFASGGKVITSSNIGFFSFKVKEGVDYLVGVSSFLYNGEKTSYKVLTSLGTLEPSNFGKYTVTDSKKGNLTTDDLMNPDTTNHYDTYYIDYYDLTALTNNVSIGDDVLLVLKSGLNFDSRLVLYDRNKRHSSGGGEIASSSNGILGFTVKSGVSYLVGVTAQESYWNSTGSYRVSTTAGLLKPSDFGKFTIVDSKEGELTTDDLINPDTTYDKDYPYYIDYYDLTDLGNNISVQAVGNEVVITLDDDFDYSNSVLFIYDKDKRNLSGGGAISSSGIGILGFTPEAGVNYLVGISSYYEADTGLYTISTSLGLLEPSNFGK